MTDAEIRNEIIEAARESERDRNISAEMFESVIRLDIHQHQKPPSRCFQGWVVILSDGSIACLVNRLPAYELAYDVYVWKPEEEYATAEGIK